MKLLSNFLISEVFGEQKLATYQGYRVTTTAIMGRKRKTQLNKTPSMASSV